jgi:cytochrome c
MLTHAPLPSGSLPVPNNQKQMVRNQTLVHRNELRILANIRIYPFKKTLRIKETLQMIKKHAPLLAAALLFSTGAYALDAAAAKALASKSACLACHAVDKKLVGPSYKDVAAKRRGQADALAVVAARIKSGGSGVYGPVPMPAQAQLKDDELKLLAAWILAGAPDK